MLKTEEPLVSVIIPCYNLGQYIEDAIESVQQQSYKNYEIIVVDDGSTELNTLSKLNSIEKKNAEIKIIRQKNAGLSEARNTGVRLAKGQYIACLDSDDMMHRDYIKKVLFKFLNSNDKKLGFVTTWVKEFGDRDGIWQTKSYNPTLLLVENVAHANSMFKKQAWKSVGGYKSEMRGGYEDWEFWISLAEKGYTWDIVEEPLFRYRIRSNSMLSEATQKHLELYGRIINMHKKIYSKYSTEIILLCAEKIRNFYEELNVKNKQLAEYNTQIKDLEVKANEFDLIKLSRVTAPALTIRSLLINARNVYRKIRSKSKNLILRFIKKIFKRVYKRSAPQINYIQNRFYSKNKPLVSIITPYYNQSATIDDTVDSVIAQTYSNFEYIIVNDGSNEGESRKLNDKYNHINKIKIINHKVNIGKGSPAAARNSGIKNARGKYIICLDGDDKLDPTYVEKCLVVMESNPTINLVSTWLQEFGVRNDLIGFSNYNPVELLQNNNIATAAMFKKEAWVEVGGYKEGIGYEDWEFWVNMAEKGLFGKLIPEPIFLYRTAHSSRFIEDRKKHQANIDNIESLHLNYVKKTSIKWGSHKNTAEKASPQTALLNLNNKNDYNIQENKPNILVAIPWMVFGGAEALLINYCNEISDLYEFHFITGLKSDNPWEDKFKKITPYVYHLANLFDNTDYYLEYISNYISTRDIDVLHIVHTDFLFNFLPDIKQRHPSLKIIVTMFNDRVPKYFNPSIKLAKYIDAYSSDNTATINHYQEKLPTDKKAIAIPNGIDSSGVFNPAFFTRDLERRKLNIADSELAVFFVGRLSEEKNPDVFIEAAINILKRNAGVSFKFFVAGDGYMEKSLHKKIPKELRDKIIFLGYISDIARLLSASDIFVLPSSVEGFPTSILEAMAMKNIIIASNVGAIPDIIQNGKNGFIVQPGCVNSIVDTVLRISLDKKLASRIKESARDTVKTKYSISILGDNYSNLYNSTINKK